MGSTKKLTQEEFIEKAQAIHGDRYDYSQVKYINTKTKVCIICPKHGEFLQTPKCHLRGHNCPKCGHESSGKYHTIHNRQQNKQHTHFNNETFIEKAKTIHGDKYDYSKLEYVNNRTKVCIICSKHGEFLQTPTDHIRGEGCPKCANEKRQQKFALTTETFIKRSNALFNYLYKYNKVNYINNSTKVLIECPQHGDFACTPSNHLKGRGCPLCKTEMYVYENRLYVFLTFNYGKEKIIRQYRSEWLTNNKSLDFYFPKYNVAIEHQGAQHFHPVTFLGGEKKFIRTQELDIEKYKECQEHGILLLYFSYEKGIDFSNFFTEVYNDENNFKKKLDKILL